MYEEIIAKIEQLKPRLPKIATPDLMEWKSATMTTSSVCAILDELISFIKSLQQHSEDLEGENIKHEEWSEDYNEEELLTRFAFYTYKDDPTILYLSNVFVEKAFHNRGFGTRILNAAEKVAEAVGAITICVKVKQDSKANAWYRKHGYGYVTFEGGYDWLEKNLEYNKPRNPMVSPSEDVEKAAEKYAFENFECEDYHDGDYFDPIGFAEESFIAGAQWQKEQMMKDAVDVNVELILHDKTGDIRLHTDYLPKELGIKYGDKVKIIIIKEDTK